MTMQEGDVREAGVLEGCGRPLETLQATNILRRIYPKCDTIT